MTALKTKESTLRALRDASGRKLSSEELEKQRISFIMGSMKSDSGMTREAVERIVAEQQGKGKG